MPSLIPVKVFSKSSGELEAHSSNSSIQFMFLEISIGSFMQMSPQSSPNSVIMVHIPVSVSPLIIARCIGFAPRYFGSNET